MMMMVMMMMMEKDEDDDGDDDEADWSFSPPRAVDTSLRLASSTAA
jgi:hypothetical protein